MTTWTIKQDCHASGALEVFEVEGTPVLVAHVGRYPQAGSHDGRSTGDTPHVLIGVVGAAINGVHVFHGVTVTAVGKWHNGVRRTMPVFQDVDYRRRDTTPDAWVALGKSKLAEAIAMLKRIDAMYQAAEAVIARAHAYSGPMSREDYEAACGACGVEPLSDKDCTGYAVAYGVFSYPEYEPQVIAAMHLAGCRGAALRHDPEAAPPATTPAVCGQLWEPCERCGSEPVYMPAHLCVRCMAAMTSTAALPPACDA